MLDEVKEGVLYMKTHELEKELGISKHTIFYYEKEGIVTPQRDDNGYRSYSPVSYTHLLKFNINSNVVKSKNNLEIARKYHHYDNAERIHVTANEDVYHIAVSYTHLMQWLMK